MIARFSRGSLVVIGCVAFVSLVAAMVSSVILGREEEESRLFEESVLFQKKLCLTTLATIEEMKISWVKDLKKKNIGDSISFDEMKAQYGRTFRLGVCPSGGVYTINPIGKHAECSFRGHNLPADWKESDYQP